MNKTLTERARSMRLQLDMSEGSWTEVVSYLVNRSPSQPLIFRSQKRYSERVSGLFNLTDIRLSGIQFGW